LWRGRSYEVVGWVEVGRGVRWTLQIWAEASAMRGVFKLEPGTIQGIADRTEAEGRNRRTRSMTFLFLPLLGMAPAKVQKKWADGWGFDPERATQVSAVCETLFGSLGIIQIASNAFGGEPFMPAWLAYPGVLLFASGCVRLALVVADGEPVGSPLGLPFVFMAPKVAPDVEQATPAVRSFDLSRGTLVLESPILRRDWDRDGLLHYRGTMYRLDQTDQEGRSWVYTFTRSADEGASEPVLRLLPPPSLQPLKATGDAEPPSFLKTMLVTAAVTLGPASDQERWAAELGIRAVWLTILGAGAELVGGIANLQNDLGPSQPLLVLLDFYLIGEGLLRLGSVLVGRSMGSVFGWILRPLYRRFLPPAR
jgi:hypothetical protein